MFELVERVSQLALNERSVDSTLAGSSSSSNRTQGVPHRSTVSPKPDMSKFISHLTQLVLKEQAIDQRSTRAMLNGSPHVLEGKGVAILNLVVIDVRKGVANKCTLTLSLPRDGRYRQVLLPTHKLKAGDAVNLKQYSVYSSVDDDDAWSGVITEIKRFHVAIALYRDEIESMLSLPLELTGSCQITKSAHNATHARMLETLSSLNSMVNRTQSPLILGLLGQTKLTPPTDDEASIDYIDKNLNEYQKDAVKFVLGSSVISLIHGPPGTGKTHTLVEIIQQLAVVQRKKILVCGPSNIAVDNLVERVIDHEGINVVRIGHPAKVTNAVVPYTLDVQICRSGGNIGAVFQAEMEKLRLEHRQNPDESQKRTLDSRMKVLNRALRQATNKSVNRVMADANVTFSTLSGSGGGYMHHKGFDVVIIDEAAQATEPECWIALLKGAKVILAGDHLQLPPTVKTPPAVVDGVVQLAKGMSSSTHLTYTLFDRLTDMFGDDIMKMLCIQYRMHDNIMRFSSDQLYGKKLIAHATNSAHLLHDLPSVSSTSHTKNSIMVIDTSDTGRTLESRGKGMNKQSTANEYEANIAIRYVKKLIQDGLTEDQIGIITPYAAQVSKILSSMGDKWQNVEVGSVDGFQGREKEAIILTLVRCNARGEVGFLAEKRRLNVAMTRAKRYLAIICDMKTLDGSKKGSGSDSSSIFDRAFLTKWMKWLDQEAVIQYSNDLNDLPA